MLCNKNDCTGCAACAEICPRQCITMDADEEGFLRPQINNDNCLKCNLCKKACPLLTPIILKREVEPGTYACWNLDERVRKISSSGGVFSAIADMVLAKGGGVAGAALNKDMSLSHRIVYDKECLAALRGSKYIQSSTFGVYREVRQLLKAGFHVLFTGTPCQIAGLYGLLGGDHERLLTCDLVCHGVPSPRVWMRYLQHLERGYKEKPTDVFFRDKEYGWKKYSLRVEMNKYVYKKPSHIEPFILGFLRNIYLRPSCHNCKFTCLQRVGDITLADFWGIAKKYPELDDDKGTSLVLVNSDKGQKEFFRCADKLFYRECELGLAVAGNPSIISSAAPSPKREQFFWDLDTLPFEKIIKKYMSPEPILSRLLRKVCQRVPLTFLYKRVYKNHNL